MLKIDYEFYKGILFIRFRGNLTKSNLQRSDINNIIINFGFKYIVFNIDRVFQIDAFCITYIKSFNKNNIFICQRNKLFFNKFTKCITIDKESEALKII